MAGVSLPGILKFLRLKNLNESADALKKELRSKLQLDDNAIASMCIDNDDSDGSNASEYEFHPMDAYSKLVAFIEKSLETYKPELSLLLYPFFSHFFIYLTQKGKTKDVQAFFEKYHTLQLDLFERDVTILGIVNNADQLHGNETARLLRENLFTVRMSRECNNAFRKFIQVNHLEVMFSYMQQNLQLEVTEVKPRQKQQLEAVVSGMLGEYPLTVNSTKVMYAVTVDPEYLAAVEEDSDDDTAVESKKKKCKREEGRSKSQADPNAPSASRIPMPVLREYERRYKLAMYRDLFSKVSYPPEVMPSLCFYSLFGESNRVTSMRISEDSTLLAAGFEDSVVRLWNLGPQRLRKIKSPDELSKIDKEAGWDSIDKKLLGPCHQPRFCFSASTQGKGASSALDLVLLYWPGALWVRSLKVIVVDDVLKRILSDRDEVDMVVLAGHSGPVYGLSFHFMNHFLLSSSQDGTVRYWSLLTFTCLVAFQGHIFPVWDVTFSPRGYYFASASADRTAQLWSVESSQSLRIFAGHLSDVMSVAFHPNSNYVSTGSMDRTVRIWDCVNGSAVRVFAGHKDPVMSLCFSPNGKYLASASWSAAKIWDFADAILLHELRSKNTCCLDFSTDSSLLATGSHDGCVKVWAVSKNQTVSEEEWSREQPDLLRVSFFTKSTSVLAVHYTRSNLLLSAGSAIG